MHRSQKFDKTNPSIKTLVNIWAAMFYQQVSQTTCWTGKCSCGGMGQVESVWFTLVCEWGIWKGGFILFFILFLCFNFLFCRDCGFFKQACQRMSAVVPVSLYLHCFLSLWFLLLLMHRNSYTCCVKICSPSIFREYTLADITLNCSVKFIILTC